MTTQVIFTTDLKTKKEALLKAKQDGITLKAVLNYCLKAFVENKISLGIINHDVKVESIEEIEVDEETQAKMDKIAAFFKSKKGRDAFNN